MNDIRPSLSTKNKLQKLEQKQNTSIPAVVQIDLNEKSSLSFSDDFSSTKRARPESYRDGGNLKSDNKRVKAFGKEANR